MNLGNTLYQYNPLPSKKFIRLLELHPGLPNDKIACTLHQTEIENAPQYEAISYAWGDPTQKVDVLCDDKIIMITKNLKDALLRFRLKDRSRIIWADAICINQNDDLEKGSQVTLMKRIYGNAMRVCVWLGCTTPQMEPAFELIDEIVSNGNLTSNHSNELSDPTSDRWSALGIFFSAAWFTRVWVVQEVYDHTCTVFCGEYELRWTDIVLVASLLLEFDPLSSANLHLENATSVIQIDTAGRNSPTNNIFDNFRNFHCSDLRDKVYALLSFPPLCELRPPIQPNYSKSVAEVFEEAAVRIFTSCENLGLFSGLEHGDAIDEEWPSWVPRWDRPRTTQNLQSYASGRAHSSLPRTKYMPKILTAEGILISTLSWCGTVIKEASANGKSETDPLKQPFREWLSKYMPKIAHPTDDPLLLSIAMTLTAGLDLESNCPPLNISQFRLNFLSYLVGVVPSLDILCTTQDLSQILSEQTRANNESMDFNATAIRGCTNKRFFCTQNGDFGMGPRAAQPGDLVVLLYGSNAPCVLRPVGSYYQFVGECYLHQHMNGEAIEMAAEGLLAVDEFEMR